uniref:C-type lectin domain-containing protein n=1 Tax=Plectus sambesii TaxID=2011161 RepID=A0A914W5X3_9BILA
MKIELACIVLCLVCMQNFIFVDGQGAPSCDSDWTLYRPTRKCYKVFTERTSWNDANVKCQQLHATLATIHSVFENNFLTELAYDTSASDPWIGLINTNGGLSWVDGSAVDYQGSWWPQHPLSNGKNCALLIGDRTDNKEGWWFDQDCNTVGQAASAYFCMKNAGITKANVIEKKSSS